MGNSISIEMADNITDLESQISSLSTQSTVNTVMSWLIIVLSICKPILLEYIKRRWAKAESTATTTTTDPLDCL